MARTLLSPDGISPKWVALVRIIIGIIIFHYGLGIFSQKEMPGNIAWLTDIGLPLPRFMAYLGKSSELLGGALLTVGLLTRFACIPMIINFGVIAFVMLNGNIFDDSQLPFLLMMFCVAFFILGGGRWSLDRILFR